MERVVAYTEISELEAPARIPEQQLSADWPEHGAIEIKQLSVRYQAHLPCVLQGISLSIAARHKVWGLL